jgi:hypothetical protein
MRAAVTALIITIINPAGVANPAVGNAAAIMAAQDTPPAPPLGIQLADAPASEAEALNRLATARSWPLRALAAMRLERFDCEASAGRLATLSQDASWRVRAYAYACLARRGVAVPPERLAAEADPRVLRTILRARYPMPLPAIDARISRLEQPGSPFDAMLALECLAALDRADDKPIRERMDDLLSRIVLRMDRPQGGVLSPRLAAVTAGDDSGRNYRWREWYRKSKARPGYEPAALVPAAAEGVRQVARNKVADLEPERFVAFEGYLTSVADRPMDLAILIDCTASMSRELADAQGGIDDLVDFLGSVTKGVRIGIVGYRDKTDDWETRGWDFTGSVDEARTRLWSLAAEGGGDTPESVHAAMKLALTRFSWLPDAAANAPQPIRAAVLVGDAPPHPGEGALCIDMAKRAAARGLRLYGIVARESETNLKPEAAEGDDNRRDDRRDNNDTAQPATDPTTPDPTTPDPTTPGPPTTPRRDPAQVEPPKPPPPTMKRRQSFTLFPEIAEAGGGRADILKDKDSLIAEIAELTIADKYREEFADFFAAFRLLCR